MSKSGVLQTPWGETLMVPEYKHRRKVQMIKFFGSALLTLASARYLQSKLKPVVIKTNPLQFYSGVRLANVRVDNRLLCSTVGGITGFTLGTLSMGVFGTCWHLDISSNDEFKKMLTDTKV
ncbi:hypothetical protein KAFR_0L01670 [Kazachstania africana CBS 2517]|uniref:Altered inheritance of mitochondria protein 11 n=1 Tax=Kazachstania africana (strain ATCC 22294 / BCRC 22015 / CBS 2517 / CECT 1963 / NBRC 1671 / NRRL Y-8276) TaxID=1071382 RepID=H2B2C7_KAZAF|nr:hypothetical protein KAFR_0L01670 [Kazachstania africana CBS 2517]CCF60777.1 hypothetical protein KAFR_0L01670 [Kazachstania africana CBS 2517]